MAYSEKAKKLRRCKALRKDGKPCRAWAVWGEDYCIAHYRIEYLIEIKKEPKRNPTCNCSAYNWPHRPGSGICNWPDPPERRCTIPAGTHRWPRYK